MKCKNVTLIDYGMGNLWSVTSALNYLGCNVLITGDPEEVFRADALVLPGVGSFRKAIDVLRKRGLDQAIIQAVQARGIKILGICLGMQLMGEGSSEDGYSSGLGLIPSKVDKFTFSEVGLNKIPHVGFDSVRSHPTSKLFRGLKDSADFYFVHSYRFLPANTKGLLAICHYGNDFMAAYENDNLFATQFHPEKSQSNGLLLLRNYLLQ